jgi:hypothetical protein
MIAVFIAGMLIGAGLLALGQHFSKPKPPQAPVHVPMTYGIFRTNR